MATADLVSRPSPGVAARVLNSLIVAYQRWVSPHKGFCCAHRVVHRGDSCSEFVRGVVLQRGAWAAIRAARERFRACAAAGRHLAQRDIQDRIYEVEQEKRRKLAGIESSSEGFWDRLGCAGDACGCLSIPACGCLPW